MYYKVLSPRLKSVAAHQMKKQYKIGCWNHANREAYKLGYGLLVFDDAHYVGSFIRTNYNLLFYNGVKVFTCEVKGIMHELPNRLTYACISLMQADGLMHRDWPIGTVMVRSLRLRAEVTYRFYPQDTGNVIPKS